MVCQLSKQGTLLLYLIKIRIESHAFQKGNLLPRILPPTIARSAIELRGSVTYKLSCDVLAF